YSNTCSQSKFRLSFLHANLHLAIVLVDLFRLLLLGIKRKTVQQVVELFHPGLVFPVSPSLFGFLLGLCERVGFIFFNPERVQQSRWPLAGGFGILGSH
ncbi:hypothetical protein QBC36DRAFT_357165, partial [Triangularia setosa]